MPVQIDIEIDKLTNSIENRVTGEVFDTDIVKLSESDSKQIKKKDWLFDWKQELKMTEKQVYKIVSIGNPMVIQGLISLEDKGDSVLMHLIEAAHFNKGKNKMYAGVAANLVAFACKFSFERGYEGYVSFFAKTALVAHYKETLGAKIVFGNYMAIDLKGAQILVDRYFNK